MDESALRRALDSLGDCSSAQYWWLRSWTLLVVIGVAFEIIFVVWEYINALHDCRRTLLYPPVKPNLPLFLLGFLGAALVATGVAGELYVGSSIATVETCIRKGNDELSLLLSKEAGDAATSAKTAHDEASAVKGIAEEARTDAKDALVKARVAQRELAHADRDAFKAQTLASESLRTATEAESHLAEALKQAAEATTELKRLSSPRILTNPKDLIALLEIHKGTEYTYSGLFADEEAGDLLRAIDNVLQSAGWKRIKPVPKFPSINVPLTDGVLEIPGTLRTGVHIVAQSTQPLEDLVRMTAFNLPAPLAAGNALVMGLHSSLFPPQNVLKLEVDTGTSPTVQIEIGKKP